MFLSDDSLKELNNIVEDEYGVFLETSAQKQILNHLGESLLKLLAAAVKARSRASRLGINIPPSCLDDVSEEKVEQQVIPFSDSTGDHYGIKK